MQVAARVKVEDAEFEFPTWLITNASIMFDRSHKLLDGQITLTIHEYMTYTNAVKSIVKSFGYYVDIDHLECDFKCQAYGKHIRYFKLNVLNPRNIKFMNKLVFTRIAINGSTISVDSTVD